MTTDDDRIGYLGGDATGAELDDAERRDLEATRALLADPAVWAEPASDLEDAVVAAIPGEAARSASGVALSTAGRRRRRWVRSGSLIGAAAAAAAAIIVAVVLVSDGGSGGPQLAASLQPTELLPRAEGDATFTETNSGWRIELDATGLPRLDNGRFYQAWLRNDAGVLVAIGTFNEPDDVVLWAGVSPREFPTITVTEEPADDDPASSGQRVLVGAVRSTR